jgi:hypothetical protein
VAQVRLNTDSLVSTPARQRLICMVVLKPVPDNREANFSKAVHVKLGILLAVLILLNWLLRRPYRFRTGTFRPVVWFGIIVGRNEQSKHVANEISFDHGLNRSKNGEEDQLEEGIRFECRPIRALEQRVGLHHAIQRN